MIIARKHVGWALLKGPPRGSLWSIQQGLVHLGAEGFLWQQLLFALIQLRSGKGGLRTVKVGRGIQGYTVTLNPKP